MFSEAEKFTKIFYHKNKRDFNFCDCYGICYLYNRDVLGRAIPEYLNEDIWSDESIDDTYHNKKQDFKKVTQGKECAGDIVSFNIKGHSVHVGVVLQRGTMLHIISGKHGSIESYNNSKWKNRVESFWRYESII